MSISIKKVIKLTWREKEVEITEDEARTLRDALLTVVPLPVVPSKLAPEIMEVNMDSGIWKLDRDYYRKNDQSVARQFVERVYSVFKPSEELSSYDVATRMQIGKSSTLTNSLSILVQTGRLVKRKIGVHTLWRIKEFNYIQKPREESLVVIAEKPDLNALRVAEQKNLEAMRQK